MHQKIHDALVTSCRMCSKVEMELFKFLTIFGLVSVIYGAQLPSSFQKCSMKDPNMDDCLSKAIQIALSVMGPGIPSISIPSIEPVEITEMDIGAGSSAVNLVQHYRGAKVFGFSKQKVPKAHFDLGKKVLTFTSLHDEIRQESKYTVNGKILLLPVYGDGDSILKFNDVTINHIITFKEEDKKGKKFFKVVEYKVDVNPEKGYYEFRNLFNGNEALGKNINQVINDNWKEIFVDVKGGVDIGYAEVLKSLAQRVFARVPISEMFN